MSPKNPAAVALGRRGGEATAKKLSKQERTDSARRAAEARWAKTLDRIDKTLSESEARLKELQRKAQASSRKAKQKKAEK